MSNKDIERWRSAALALDKRAVVSPDVPVGIKLLEDDSVAAFILAFWEPAVDGSRPGLKSVENLLAYEVAEEIQSLVRAVRTVHADALFAVVPPSDRPELTARATDLTHELSDACELVLDDDVHEAADDALAQAKARMTDDATFGTMVQALVDLSAIADTIKDRLGQLSDFNLGWIAEARALANKLSVGGAPQSGKDASPEIELRNRLLVLLDERVRKVRRIARYVFRKHPEVIRMVTSAYERRRRVEAKRRKRAEAEKPPTV